MFTGYLALIITHTYKLLSSSNQSHFQAAKTLLHSNDKASKIVSRYILGRILFLKVIFTDHSTYTVRNKFEILKRKGEANFDTPFIIQSHAESIKKIVDVFL